MAGEKLESAKIKSVVPIKTLSFCPNVTGKGEKGGSGLLLELWRAVAKEVIRAWWRAADGPLVVGAADGGGAAADAKVVGCCLHSTLDRDDNGI